MTELICQFHDYLSAVSPAEKYNILKNSDVAVIKTLEPSLPEVRQQHIQMEIESYRQLVTELRRVFRQNSSIALAALIAAGPETILAQHISERARSAIS